MENENFSYKLSLLKNPRYLIFLFLLILIFCINLFFFYFYKNYIFLAISFISITIFSYAIFKLQSALSQSITIYNEYIEYKRSRFETEKIYYHDIRVGGYYKKDLNNFNKFSFSDGLFLYDEKNDKYILIGIGFNDYKDIYKKLEEKSRLYKFKWYNIQRDKKSNLVSELKKIVSG